MIKIKTKPKVSISARIKRANSDHWEELDLGRVNVVSKFIKKVKKYGKRINNRR